MKLLIIYIGFYELAETHKHILVTGYLAKAPDEQDINYYIGWFKKLVDEVDMKILFGPHVVYCNTDGNEGLTGLVCIETSHSSIHFWSEPEPHYRFDLYSCKDFSIDSISKMLKEFGTTKFTYTVVDRTDDSHPITSSGIQYL